MGDVKLKIWDKQNLKWHTDWRGLFPWGIDPNKPEEVMIGIMPNRFEVNLYTGINDKNKKEIYSSYIVDFVYLDEKYRSEVKFYNGAFCVEWPLGRLLLSELSTIEVIGNIYENPELLS